MKDAKRIIGYLEELKRTNSTNEKVELLKTALTDEMFKQFCQLALTSTYSYNMSNIPKINSHEVFFKKDWTLKDIFAELEKMIFKTGMTDVEKIHFAEMVSEKEFYQIASLIVKKKLDCGINAKLVNKAVPGTIFIMPYMRCSGSDKIDRIKYPAILDVKADGMFLNTIICNGKVEFRTRPGNIFPLNNPKINKFLLHNFQTVSVVLLGEARIWDGMKQQFLPRKTGNGLLNQILKGNTDQDLHDSVRLAVWDIIPFISFYRGEYSVPYNNRVEFLNVLSKSENLVTRIESAVVYDKQEAYEVAEKWMNDGEEGGILKNFKGVWKNHTSPDCIKIKAEKVCELKITGWEYGAAGTKYEKMMGSVLCESEDNKLAVWVSGWNDEERNWDWDEHIGKIISVKFNEVIESKSKTATSLFLPRVCKSEDVEFVEFRSDKTEADTYEEICKL